MIPVSRIQTKKNFYELFDLNEIILDALIDFIKTCIHFRTWIKTNPREMSLQAQVPGEH